MCTFVWDVAGVFMTKAPELLCTAVFNGDDGSVRPACKSCILVQRSACSCYVSWKEMNVILYRFLVNSRGCECMLHITTTTTLRSVIFATC